MYAPCDPGDLEQAIRGHELVHAGWSPILTPNEIARKHPSELDPEDVRACEEWRVNAIAYSIGIDSMILHDPGAEADAIKFARARQLAPALRLIVETHGTGAHRRVLKNLRKHAPEEWAKPIAHIQKAIRDTRRAHNLADRQTATIRTYERDQFGNVERMSSETIPRGFLATIALAQDLAWWQRNDPTPTRAEEEERKGRQARAVEKARQQEAEERASRNFRERPEFDLEGTNYESVRLAHLEHTLRQTGKIARKKIASDTGKNPRRIARIVTDPSRRVFDRKIRARGGVVLIDQSGSMSLERSDIDRVLEHAGGAIVIGYSNTGKNRANVWVHAQNGQRALFTPTGGSANDVDGSALVYAISRREQRRDPIIWVTDGGCYEPGSNSIRPKTGAIVANLVERERVTMVKDIESAISELGRLQRGNQPRTKLDPIFQRLRNEWKGKA
jgi:Mg-chelatase subunit ChlD